MCGGEGGKLCGRRFRLVFCFPLRKGFAVDAFARCVLVHGHATRLRRVAVPVGQTIAAEAAGNHQVDVLHVAARMQMIK